MSSTSLNYVSVARQSTASLIGAAGVCAAWLVLMTYGASLGLWKPVGFSIVAALALLIGSVLVAGPRQTGLVRAVDGAAGGAMLAGMLLFVMPDALHHHVVHGSIGLLLGCVLGAAITYYPWQRRRHDPAVVALTLHALCAGCVIGALYARMPALGVAAGAGIIAHKLPAGYLLSRQLENPKTRLRDITLPALATGLGALPVALWRPDSALPAGLLLGIAAGLFAYVGIVFGRRLPKTTRFMGVELGAALVGGTTVAFIALLGVLTNSMPGW